jgi:hypothetical protein
MSIDDPVAIELQYTKNEIEKEKYLPNLAARLGLSAVAAAVLAKLRMQMLHEARNMVQQFQETGGSFLMLRENSPSLL